jgi:hypothetical protein
MPTPLVLFFQVQITFCERSSSFRHLLALAAYRSRVVLTCTYQAFADRSSIEVTKRTLKWVEMSRNEPSVASA